MARALDAGKQQHDCRVRARYVLQLDELRADKRVELRVRRCGEEQLIVIDDDGYPS